MPSRRKAVAAAAAAAYSALHRQHEPSQEHTMTRPLTQHAVSFSLALAVTISTLLALNGLAAADHAAPPQQLAATQPSQG
jgi:hypothetical protein